MRQQLLEQNPNMLFITELRIHNHLASNGDAFPEGSDFYIRDSNGQIIRNTNGQYVMNILNRDLQDLLIERIVGFSACGIFDGILIDGFLSHGIGHADYFSFGTPEDHIIAITRILREARARVRDDFLIIVNANFSKPTRYAEFINGSSMEPGADYAGIGGGTYKRLQVLDDTLLWNEKNLREPIFNWAEFFYLPTEPPNSPANEQRMRLATARGLTHSDGYVRLTYKGEHGVIGWINITIGMISGIPTLVDLLERRDNCMMKTSRVYSSASSRMVGQSITGVALHSLSSCLNP